MTEITELPVGAPIWFDLSSSDPDAAAAFYGAVFGWRADANPPEFGGYVNFMKGDDQVAGMVKNPGPSFLDGWIVYLKSDDAHATAAAITAAGGSVLMPPMNVSGLGTMVVSHDPGGATIGVWQPGSMRGTENSGELGAHGTPAWFELHTRAFAAEIAFYEKAFGWTTAVMGDSDEFRYSQLKVGETFYAGVMDGTNHLPEGSPSLWEVYIAVDDADAAVARAVEAGGQVVLGAEDTPFGRLAKIADPTGATIKVIQAPPAA